MADKVRPRVPLLPDTHKRWLNTLVRAYGSEFVAALSKSMRVRGRGRRWDRRHTELIEQANLFDADVDQHRRNGYSLRQARNICLLDCYNRAVPERLRDTHDQEKWIKNRNKQLARGRRLRETLVSSAINS